MTVRVASKGPTSGGAPRDLEIVESAALLVKHAGRGEGCCTMTSVLTQLTSAGVAYAPQIASAASKHDLDPKLLAAVAAQETGSPGSNAGRNVVGDGGHGRGLFQIDDRYHSFARTAAAMDPAKNADYAAGMLSGLLCRYGGNVREALSAYNAGDPHAAGTRTTWNDGSTLDYADSVMRHYDELGGTGTLEEARAEQPTISSSIGALLSQALSQPSGALPVPTVPQHQSWQNSQGLDATGHSRDGSSNVFDDNEGDDS
jgi:hypothetical protein